MPGEERENEVNEEAERIFELKTFYEYLKTIYSELNRIESEIKKSIEKVKEAEEKLGTRGSEFFFDLLLLVRDQKEMVRGEIVAVKEELEEFT